MSVPQSPQDCGSAGARATCGLGKRPVQGQARQDSALAGRERGRRASAAHRKSSLEASSTRNHREKTNFSLRDSPMEVSHTCSGPTKESIKIYVCVCVCITSARVHYARPPWGYPDGKSSFFHDGFSSTSPRASSSGAPHPRICPARAPQARNPGALGMALAACRARPWPVHPLSRSPGGTAARSSERGEPHSMRGRGAPARRTRAKHAPIAHVWPPIGQ